MREPLNRACDSTRPRPVLVDNGDDFGCASGNSALRFAKARSQAGGA